MRIDQLRVELELECAYHPFPLHPETPDDGMSLEQLFGGRLDVPAAMEQMRNVADSIGLAFGDRSYTYNSRKSQELGLWVETQGAFKAYEKAVYSAYFVDGVNIAQLDNLMKIVTGLGLSVTAARQALQDHSYSAAVDREWDQAVAAGVRAVPTIRCEGRELVGFQSLEACRKLIAG